MDSMFVSNFIHLTEFTNIVSVFEKKVVHVKNVLVVFLSIFDLIYSISQIFLIHRRFNDHQWIFGEVVCKFTMISPFSIMSSIYIILLIAIDRHRSIMYPYKRQFTKKTLYYAVHVTSTISLLVQLPSVRNIKLLEEAGYKDCAKSLIPNDSAYTDLFLFIISYLVPIILFLVCYTAIISKVRRSERKRSETCSMQPIKLSKKRSNKRNTRMTAVLLSLIIAFIVTSTPNLMMILWFAFGDLTAPNAKIIFVVFHLLSSLIHTNSFVNAIIYSICDPSFCRKFCTKKVINLEVEEVTMIWN